MSNQRQSRRLQWDGKRIQALRHHLGLTQRKLAEELGTRQQTISEWETGMYQPRGTSATLLSLVAERAKFEYQPVSKEPDKEDVYNNIEGSRANRRPSFSTGGGRSLFTI